MSDNKVVKLVGISSNAYSYENVVITPLTLIRDIPIPDDVTQIQRSDNYVFVFELTDNVAVNFISYSGDPGKLYGDAWYVQIFNASSAALDNHVYVEVLKFMLRMFKINLSDGGAEPLAFLNGSCRSGDLPVVKFLLSECGTFYKQLHYEKVFFSECFFRAFEGKCHEVVEQLFDFFSVEKS